MNKKIPLLAFTLALMLTSLNVSAANATSNNVNISLLSARDEHSQILIQTAPRPDVSGLSCTQDFWLTLDKGASNFEELYVLLLAAQSNNKKVNITYDDNNSADFCRLNRVTIRSN